MKLTGEELTRLAVEKVIGWQLVPHQGRFDEELWILPANGAPLIDPMRFADFRPLEEWKWAGLIVDKMRADGWRFEVREIVHRSVWSVKVCVHRSLYDKETGSYRYKEGLAVQSSYQRAFTISSLSAVGAITEDQV